MSYSSKQIDPNEISIILVSEKKNTKRKFPNEFLPEGVLPEVLKQQ